MQILLWLMIDFIGSMITMLFYIFGLGVWADKPIDEYTRKKLFWGGSVALTVIGVILNFLF